MRRSAPVTRGTDEHRQIPAMSSSNEKPWKPRNSCTTRACSSAVRSALVATLQWSSRWVSARTRPTLWASSGSRSYSPITVCVLPTSITSSITGGEATRRRQTPTNRGLHRFPPRNGSLGGHFGGGDRGSVRHDVEADVERGCGVGEGADRDQVGARGGVGPDRVERYPAGDLEQRPAGVVAPYL